MELTGYYMRIWVKFYEHLLPSPLQLQRYRCSATMSLLALPSTSHLARISEFSYILALVGDMRTTWTRGALTFSTMR